MLTFFERPRTNIKTVRKIAFIFHERQKFMKQSKQKQFVCCDVEKKIDILLAKMTLEEKIGQLNQVGPSAVGGFEISLAEQKSYLMRVEFRKKNTKKQLTEPSGINKRMIFEQEK